jgi:hypothetical protein
LSNNIIAVKQALRLFLRHACCRNDHFKAQGKFNPKYQGQENCSTDLIIDAIPTGFTNALTISRWIGY